MKSDESIVRLDVFWQALIFEKGCMSLEKMKDHPPRRIGSSVGSKAGNR